jgi:hypothetical protein
MTQFEHRAFLDMQSEFGIKRMDSGKRNHGGERRRVFSPDEQAQVDSLIFHLEGFKTAQSKIGKVTAVRKVYEILQMSHDLKRDYFGLPSLANFWKTYEKLQENYQTFDPEALFWIQAIAVLVLFKDTKSTDIFIPSYAMTIIEGLSKIILQDLSPRAEPKREEIQSCSSRLVISNTFSKRRKFSSTTIKVGKIETGSQSESRTFIAKRKTTGISSSESADSGLKIEVHCDDFGSISTLWTAMAALLNVEDIENSYSFEADHLVPLTSLIINRYLHLLISSDAVAEIDQSSQNDQLQQIFNQLRSMGILGKISASVVQLIKLEMSGDLQNYDRVILWCNLGILESACFRNGFNQVFSKRFLLCVLLSFVGIPCQPRD